MSTIPTTEPTELTAGDTLQFTKSLADYLASESWVLSYVLINAAQKYTFNASASGSDHAVSVSAATTAAWAAGTYSWQAYVTKSGERFTVGTGSIIVKPNLSAATTLDNRSHVKKTLDAIEAVIEQRASIDQQEYSIQGRSLKRTPMADLIKLREKYAALYKQEQNAENINAGRGGKNKILTRF